jgi:lipoprotein-anchoring transpeptidase ErfK/SrfK
MMKPVRFIVILSLFLLFLIIIIWGISSRKHNLAPNTLSKDLSGSFDYSQKSAYFEGKNIEIPDSVFKGEQQPADQEKVLSLAVRSDRWVEVDLSEQHLWAWDGDKLFLETPVSTGLPWFPTPTGEFVIWVKLRATRMEGGTGKYYYDLPNVPYVMYFENDEIPAWRGYGLHGTYWHNDFGHVHSHGCVNLPTSAAKELYYFLYPNLPEGKSSVYASADNPGSRVVIHE